MPRKLWAVGEEVIAADFSLNVSEQVVAVFASAAARTAAWPAPPTGAVSFLTDSLTMQIYNGAQWVCVTPQTGLNLAASTYTGTTYSDMVGGVGPAVSILTGAKALVTVSANINNSGGASAVFMSYAVSGATTRAASDNEALAVAGASGHQQQSSMVSYLGGLTPGINTFTAKYRAAAGTLSASLRIITVVAIP